MIAGILRLDGAGFTKNRDVTKRITVSCRQASVLFSAILKAKGIPCRSRAGFMDFGDAGDSYMEHWVNEYWDLGRTGGFWQMWTAIMSMSSALATVSLTCRAGNLSRPRKRGLV